MTCPVGMVWEKNTCIGMAKKFELKFIPEIIKLANNQLEGSWRLPTRNELESLICLKCNKVKINFYLLLNEYNLVYILDNDQMCSHSKN